MSVDELDASFRRYLALDDDYDAIRRELVEGHGYDRIMEAAISVAREYVYCIRSRGRHSARLSFRRIIISRE